MATTAPSWTPLISRILGSSTNASKIGKSPVDGLKKMYSTPAALSCCTNSAPPVPFTSRLGHARDEGNRRRAVRAAAQGGRGRILLDEILHCAFLPVGPFVGPSGI